MKSFILALVIGACVVVGGIWYSARLDKLSGEMEQMSADIIKSIYTEDFEKAQAKTEALSDFVEQKRAALASTLDHENLDKIEMNMSELRGYVEGKNKVDALAKGMVLENMFRHLPKDYKVRLENIL